MSAERIAEVLKAHQWWFVGVLGVPGMAEERGYKCACGWETHATAERDVEDPHGHVAAAVLASMEATLLAHRPYGLDCKCDRPINSDADWVRHVVEALGEDTER